MRRAGSGLAILAGLLPLFLAASVVQETRDLAGYPGDLNTLRLLAGGSGRWEYRIETPQLLALVSEKRDDDSIELVLRLLAVGEGRLETVLLDRGSVVKRVVYRYRIDAVAPTNRSPLTNARPPERTGRPETVTPADEELRLARRVFDDGAFAEAVPILSNLAARHASGPVAVESRLLLGISQSRLGRHRQALETLRAAESGDDARLRYGAVLWRGHVHEALGEFQAATDAFLAAMRGPSLPEVDIRARTALALLQARLGQVDAAREQFARIFQLYPAGSAGQGGGAYPIALYSAAEFYDGRPEVRDVDRAYAYYRRYLTRIRPLLRAGSLSTADARMHRAWAARAAERVRFLKENFLDYR